MQGTFHRCSMPNPIVPGAYQPNSTLSRDSTIPNTGTRVPGPGHTGSIPSHTTSLHQRHTTRHSTAHSNTRQFLATTYNCKGLMQSTDYIATLLKSADALFLSETWLRPYQSQVIFDVLSQHGFNICDNVVFHKSDMINAPPDYTGRPYDGVSWVFNTNSSLSYREIECSSDQVIPEQVMCGKQHMQVLIGVCTPFYQSGDRQQTAEFIATLDAIQTVVVEYAQLGPVGLVGDLNVQLPRGFFITNNFVCVDFEYEQNLTYTYFQHETNMYTWLDHILSNGEHSRSDQSITRCFVHDYDKHNMSDHLPLSFIVECKFSACNNVTETCISRRRTPYWENFAVREKNTVNKWVMKSLNYQHCSWGQLFSIQMKPYPSLMTAFRQLANVFCR